MSANFDGAQASDTIQTVWESFIIFFPPAEGEIVFLNDTDSYITVETFDERDGLRWIPYQRQSIAPHDAAKLTARGNKVQVRVVGRSLFVCDKSTQYYLYNGQGVFSQVS
jgi:hypothetical protein